MDNRRDKQSPADTGRPQSGERVERATGKFLGLVSLGDLLKARTRNLEEERRRDRPLKLRFLFPGDRITQEPEAPTTP